VSSAPTRITIVPDDYHVPYAGTAADGRRFFASDELFAVTGPGVAEQYGAVFFWTAEGDFDEVIRDVTERSRGMPPGQAVPAIGDGLASRLAELGDYVLEPIEVAPFSIEIDGVRFGFVAEDHDGEWYVTVQPGNFIAYYEPWDGLEYDT
jgi:hypothetical protein